MHCNTVSREFYQKHVLQDSVDQMMTVFVALLAVLY